jgi:lipopolysaccharide export system permease protein
LAALTLSGLLGRSLLMLLSVNLLGFVLLFEMADLFANMWRYLSQNIPLEEILWIQLLYLPWCIQNSLPIAFLFSVTFCLGDMYARNELIAVLGGGISLYRFLIPVFLLAAILAGFSAWFEDGSVVESMKRRNELINTVLRFSPSYNNSNLVLLGSNPEMVYLADFYNDAQKSISGLTIIRRDAHGGLAGRLDAETAQWNGAQWDLRGVKTYRPAPDGGFLEFTRHPAWQETAFSDGPDLFRRNTRRIEELTGAEARDFIAELRRAGMPYKDALTNYHRRHSRAAVFLVIAVVMLPLAGRFRKNVLLLSLLSGLSLIVVYYVLEMVLVLMARLGYIAPIVGAWGGLALFACLGALSLRFVKS